MSNEVEHHVQAAVRAARARVARLTAARDRLGRQLARAEAVLAETEALAARLGVATGGEASDPGGARPAPRIRAVVLGQLRDRHPDPAPITALRLALAGAGIPAGHPKSLPKTLQRLRQAGLVAACDGGWRITAAGLARAAGTPE